VDWDGHTHVALLTGGEKVSYIDIGTGQGPVVLLVHGLGGSWRVWLENVLFLATTHRVIAVDLPGFGESPPHLKVIVFDAFARVLEELCEELGIDRVVAIGNSFGGWVCTELALRNPALVAALVLVDAAGVPATRRERVKVVGMLKLADRMAPTGCKRREQIAASPALRRRAFGFIASRADLLPADLAIHLLPEVPSPVFRRVLEAAVSSWSHSWCAEVQQLTVPALVVWGSLDKQLPLRHAHEWVRLLRRSTLFLVPGAGHLPMIEEPLAFNTHVVDFLQSESLMGRAKE
jgi:pimeloyl-ACP methyl ester carboxylesterase